jgi:glycosyltransferase involved in cell wall biosynthesis
LAKQLAQVVTSYDALFFFTYLYYPTALALPPLGSKAVLIPTAHDEEPLYLERSGQVFASARVILANSEAEAALIRRRLPVARSAPILVAGVGVEAPSPSSVEPGREVAGFQPYVVYLGRITAGKGVDRLIDYFASFVESHPGRDLTLVLAGQSGGDVPIPPVPWIRSLGFVPDETKWRLLAGAAALVNPSPMESLSLVVLEALTFGVPVLVDAHSDVLRDYAARLPSVFGYSGSEDFQRELDRILMLDWKGRGRLALEESRRWAETQFGWRKVLGMYEEAVRVVTGPAS